MRIKSLSLAAAFLALSAFTPRDVAASGAEIAPLRIAVFVGGGARNIGAFRWLEIATLAENAETTPVDGASIRAGALDAADVLVTDAFSGNIVMKMYEGTATSLLRIIKGAFKSSVPGMIGGTIAKRTLKKALKNYDATIYGGAPLLGVKGLVVKAHGSAKEKEFGIAVEQCATFFRENVNGAISERMEAEAAKIRELKKKSRSVTEADGKETLAP